jgi:hypothetical protein
MRWQKRGLVVVPRTELWWMRSHAMVPTLQPLTPPYVKVYFSGRDDKNRSHIGYAVIDLDIAEEDVARAVVEFSSEPVLGLGALGGFDDNGVSPSCVVDDGKQLRLYYIGWNKGATVRMHLFGGLALSTDAGKSFARWSRAPVIERTDCEPFLNTAPYAVRTDAGWRLYFVCCTEWLNPDLPRYHIRSAESGDGFTWRRNGHVCIDYAGPHENALARPMVMRDGEIWRMWFAHKGKAYRMGYAESYDGLNWTRDDSYAGIDVSPGAFDSEMLCYGAILRHRDRLCMFYNGNDYGRGGVGLAFQER